MGEAGARWRCGRAPACPEIGRPEDDGDVGTPSSGASGGAIGRSDMVSGVFPSLGPITSPRACLISCYAPGARSARDKEAPVTWVNRGSFRIGGSRLGFTWGIFGQLTLRA